MDLPGPVELCPVDEWGAAVGADAPPPPQPASTGAIASRAASAPVREQALEIPVSVAGTAVVVAIPVARVGALGDPAGAGPARRTGAAAGGARRGGCLGARCRWRASAA